MKRDDLKLALIVALVAGVALLLERGLRRYHGLPLS